MRNGLLCLFLIFSTYSLFSQRSYSLSFFDNATLLPPRSFIAFANQPIHPGVCASYEFHWKNGSNWFQSVKLGYYNHQFVQSGIQLYSEYGYRKKFGKVFSDLAMGAGYLHAIPSNDRIQLNGQGIYEVVSGPGIPQIMFGPSLGAGYSINTYAAFINYQVWMQSPFVPGYVPILPNGSLHIGLRYTPLK